MSVVFADCCEACVSIIIREGSRRREFLQNEPHRNYYGQQWR